jgi:hypothetical protein
MEHRVPVMVSHASNNTSAPGLFRCIYLQHLRESGYLRAFSERLHCGRCTKIDPVIARSATRENRRLLHPTWLGSRVAGDGCHARYR